MEKKNNIHFDYTCFALVLIRFFVNDNILSIENIINLLGVNRYVILNCVQLIRSWGIKIIEIFCDHYKLFSPIQLFDIPLIYKYIVKEKLFIFSIINSTNQYLIDHIAYLSIGDVCISEYQLKGRGRYGRVWLSPFGVNLCFSIYWRLNITRKIYDGLNLSISVIIADFFRNLGIKGISVKWPNDIYLYTRKLAGILIEYITQDRQISHIIIGVGINLYMIANHNMICNEYYIYLKKFGYYINKSMLLSKLINVLWKFLQVFEDYGFSFFLNRWLYLDCLYNRPVYLFIGNDIIRGIERGINDRGELLLEHSGRVYTYCGDSVSLRSQ